MNQRSGIDHHHIYSTETKEEENGGRDILPLEMEDGRKTESAPPAEVKKRGFCARHKGKLIFLGIVALILIALAIAIPLLMPKDPTATLLEQSNLRLDGLGAGSATIDLSMKVQNPNPYAIAFEDLRLDVYDFSGAHIGELTRPERFRVQGRSTNIMNATATMQPSFFEILSMGVNCLQNDNLTKLKLQGTVQARFAGRTFRTQVGPMEQLTQCVATNIAGGSSPPPPGVTPAAVGNGQIINSIGEAISQGIQRIRGGRQGAASQVSAAPGNRGPNPVASSPFPGSRRSDPINSMPGTATSGAPFPNTQNTAGVQP
ncbi:hypothetical protein NSK_006485 [Nannochloropsis salina CCMP1776]|uniref:Late embryogenesis abundant protein LEA-2 subgroup domain-containing protein n=1 Tax=Nannochloropsis salina CCMP1776 TaxID=1027361 RepID=A0A4D9CTH6_9STRA|nr:hypothetical protein NSK_006485 [Nannochloropsis salina CCMP1776]|eukprot:TFJ82156.1 hypothetical protein NSK_006485 [Nannochloropsis salina CCMP1776]